MSNTYVRGMFGGRPARLLIATAAILMMVFWLTGDLPLLGDSQIEPQAYAGAGGDTRQVHVGDIVATGQKDGDGRCDGNLSDGIRDPGFCEGSDSCQGGTCQTATTGAGAPPT